MRTAARREEVAKHMAQSNYGIDWSYVLEHYAGDRDHLRRHVIMATLKVSGGWTYEQIATAMGLDRGRVCHIVRGVLDQMKIAALETALAEELETK